MLYYTYAAHTHQRTQHKYGSHCCIVRAIPPSIDPLPQPLSPLDHPLCHSNVTNIIRWKVPWLENYTGITFWEEKELNKQALGYHMDFMNFKYLSNEHFFVNIKILPILFTFRGSLNFCGYALLLLHLFLKNKIHGAGV